MIIKRREYSVHEGYLIITTCEDRHMFRGFVYSINENTVASSNSVHKILFTSRYDIVR